LRQQTHSFEDAFFCIIKVTALHFQLLESGCGLLHLAIARYPLYNSFEGEIMPLNRPMHDMLTDCKNRLRLHVPGHKGQSLFGGEDVLSFDMTELDVTDDLYHPSGAIARAQVLLAASAGAGHSLFITGGSTAGILTMLLYAAKPGDTVILPRNAHISCIHGCILADLNPVYIPFEITTDGYAYTPAEAFLKVMEQHPEAKAILVTRPDYYGGMIPLADITAAAHARGMRLLVDEAHGAHLNWMPDVETASSAGADLWVQSAHKTLPVMTAGAFLHLGKQEDEDRARRMLRMVQTSSPAFYLMKSMDDARAWMDAYGENALIELKNQVNVLRHRLKAMGYQDAHESWCNLPLSYDETRLVISAPQGGFALAAELKSLAVDAEMADERRIVCILSVMDGDETFVRLESALSKVKITSKGQIFAPNGIHKLPRRIMSPRQAALGNVEWVEIERAVGRVLASSAGLYPPGIPLIAPGEEIPAEIVAILLSAPQRSRFGIDNRRLLCVKEL